MRDSVKIIRFISVITILLFVSTYLITLNIEMHIIELNSLWISNNLALTVFGGAFASMLVVLVCEIQKYITTKKSVENHIFYQALYLYQSLFLMQQNICDYQKNSTIDVPNNLLDETTRMILCQITELQCTDYVTLIKKSNLITVHQEFCQKTAINMQPIINGCSALKIAISKVKIIYLSQNLPMKAITSMTEPLKSVLDVQHKKISKALEETDEYLENIDKYCGYRFKWKEQQKRICSNYVSIFETWNFDREYQKEI